MHTGEAFKSRKPDKWVMENPKYLVEFVCKALGFSNMDTAMALNIASEAHLNYETLAIFKGEDERGYAGTFKPGKKALDETLRERLTRTYYIGKHYYGCYLIDVDRDGKLSLQSMDLHVLAEWGMELVPLLMDLGNEVYMWRNGKKPDADYESDMLNGVSIEMKRDEKEWRQWTHVDNGYTRTFRIYRFLYTVKVIPGERDFDVTVDIQDHRPHINPADAQNYSYHDKLEVGDRINIGPADDAKPDCDVRVDKAWENLKEFKPVAIGNWGVQEHITDVENFVHSHIHQITNHWIIRRSDEYRNLQKTINEVNWDSQFLMLIQCTGSNGTTVRVVSLNDPEKVETASRDIPFDVWGILNGHVIQHPYNNVYVIRKEDERNYCAIPYVIEELYFTPQYQFLFYPNSVMPNQ